MNTSATLELPAPAPIRCTDWLGRIVCGDNTEVLSGFPAECVDLVVTSPPYDELRQYGGHLWDFCDVANQLVRVLKPGGVLVWVVGDATVDGSETGTSMEQALYFRKLGLRIHDTMIYATNKPPMNDRRYQACWEYMFVLSKGAPKTWNPIMERCTYAGSPTSARYREKNGDMKDRHGENKIGDTKPKENIWWLPSGSGKEESLGHPAPFPLTLAKNHIASWSNPGDVVLDPFAGSGTTCKAAKELERQWCGIEINPKYCAIAEGRLSQDVLQLETCAMRPNVKVSET